MRFIQLIEMENSITKTLKNIHIDLNFDENVKLQSYAQYLASKF